MTWKLFLDDLRAPPDGTWVVARTVPAAIEYIEEYGLPFSMSLDHDLGTGTDAPVLVHWLIDQHLDGRYDIRGINVHVHSANTVGVDNLEGLWSSFLRFTQ